MKRTLLKWLKRIGWFVLILFLSVNIFILLSGRFYLYKGIYYTYLQGETSPTIYDLSKFYNATVKAPTKKEPWDFNLLKNEVLGQLAERKPPGVVFDIGSLKTPLRGGLDRLLHERTARLSTLVVHTAGTRMAAVSVSGLDAGDAEHLRERLATQVDHDDAL